MTEQQAPFGETDQMWVPSMSDDAIKLSDPNAVHVNMLRGVIAKPTPDQIVHLYGVDCLIEALARFSAAERAIVAHLRNPESAAVGCVVQNHSFVRDRAQVVRILHAYAEALEQVILPAVKP